MWWARSRWARDAEGPVLDHIGQADEAGGNRDS